MPKIKLAGLPKVIPFLPDTLFMTIIRSLLVPGQEGASTQDLSGGRTKVHVGDAGGGGEMSVVVKNYESGPHENDPTDSSYITGGTIRSISVLTSDEAGDHNFKITKLGVDAAALLDTVFSGGAESSTDLPDLIFGLDWVIVGTGDDDEFSWGAALVKNVPDGHLFAGNDRFFGLAGDDTLRLYKGHDTGLGGAGHDTIYGNQGRDRLKGQAGHDTLVGGTGADKLFGGKGRDTLEGGRGRDIMDGGRGADTFVFGTKAGNDVIRNFNPNNDTISFDAGVSGVRIESTAQGARIVHSEGHIDLIGVNPGQIDTADILGW